MQAKREGSASFKLVTKVFASLKGSQGWQEYVTIMFEYARDSET